ncbi:MAG: hypothetical protein Rubg2KO_03140 [Rubricoccaceae bacterium]
MSQTDPFNVRSFRLALRTTGIGFALGLALVLLDTLAGVPLPQPFRSALPWVLILSSAVGITLLVGSLGTPKRRSTDRKE